MSARDPHFWNDLAKRDAELLATAKCMWNRAWQSDRHDEAEVASFAMVHLRLNLSEARTQVAAQCAPWFEVQR